MLPFRPFSVIPERKTFNASGLGGSQNYYIERYWSHLNQFFALYERPQDHGPGKGRAMRSYMPGNFVPVILHTQSSLSSNPDEVSMEQVEEVDY